MTDIEFSGNYSKEMVHRAVGLGNTPSRRRLVLRWTILLLALSLSVAMAVYYSTHSDPDILGILRSLLVLPVVAFFMLLPRVSSWRTASQLWKDDAIRRPVTGRITATGISMVFGRSKAEFKWEEFARVRKKADLVVLVTAEGDISILPRSFFHDDSDWGSFCLLVDMKVVEPG